METLQFLTLSVIICETIRLLDGSKSSIRFIKLCNTPFKRKLCSFVGGKISQNNPKKVKNQKLNIESESIRTFLVTFRATL